MLRFLRRTLFILGALLTILFVIMNLKVLMAPAFVAPEKESALNTSESVVSDSSLGGSILSDSTEQKLSALIQIESVSRDGESFQYRERMLTFLRAQFPEVFKKLQFREDIKDGIVFFWKGSVPQSKAYLFLGHLDVVPVEEETKGQWTHPPFSGAVAEGYVWGRGSLDDKSGCIAQMEALESLLKTDFTPAADLYFAFGLDEEIGGPLSAQKISAELAKENLKFTAIFDEGGAILMDAQNLSPFPVALIAVGEKGYVTFHLKVELPGGHSSVSKKETAITVLVKALSRLENNPPPKRMTAAVRQMIEVLAPSQNYFKKLIYSNLWLTEKLILWQAQKSRAFLSIVQSHYSITLINSGLKENVIPGVATAVVNSRILPGDTVEDVEQRLVSALADERIKIEVNRSSVAPPLSSTETPIYFQIQKTLKDVFPNVLIAPTIATGATDSRHYSNLSSEIYRFRPFQLTPADLSRIHGIDERIKIEDLKKSVLVYRELIKKL